MSSHAHKTTCSTLARVNNPKIASVKPKKTRENGRLQSSDAATVSAALMVPP